jgi:hypothetical protein
MAINKKFKMLAETTGGHGVRLIVLIVCQGFFG